jgi:DNA repair exonuclease SbcCD ATPase subunit
MKMKKLMYVAVPLLLAFGACEGPNNKTTTVDDPADIQENYPSDEISTDTLSVNFEDLEDRQKDFKDQLNQLKAEKPQRTSSRTETTFEEQLSAIERQVDELGMKTQALRSAEDDGQEESFQQEFEKIEAEIESRINAFKDEFEPNQD